MTAAFDTSAGGIEIAYDTGGSANTTLVCNVPANVVNGDLMIAYVANMTVETPTNITPPAGWTQIYYPTYLNGRFTTVQAAWYRIASSEPASYTWTVTGDTRDDAVAIMRVTGHNAGSPIDVAITGALDYNGTSPASPSVTTASADTLLVALVAANNGSLLSAVDSGYPSGMTGRFLRRSRNNSAGVIFGVAYETRASAGATGDRVWTSMLTSSGYGGVGMFAIKAGAGDTTAPVLTSPTGVATSGTAATVGATTDEGNGTLYAVVTGSATQPSIAQIKAGNDHTGSAAVWSGNVAVSSTGAKTLNATGLTAGSSYYVHLVHTDAAANDSNRVTSSQWTQLVKKVKLKLALAAAGETVDGIVWANQVGGIAGAEIGEFTGQTIGTGSGADAGLAVLKVPVSVFGGGSLSVGDTVQMFVRNATKSSDLWPATIIEE